LTTGDHIDLQAGADSFTLQLVSGATVDGGDGIDTLLVGSLGAGGQINVNLDAALFDQISGNGTYTGFENLDGAASSRSLSVVAGTDTTSIVTGNLTDLIDAGAANTGVTINANGGTDTITGSDHNDTINAGSGADMIIAGGGADILTGGADADMFVFADGFGDDMITDFVIGQDNLDIAGVTNFDHMEVTGADDAVITLYDVSNTALGSITLSDVSSTDASNWLFA
jgi:Ca2+-binding RTX toxin-like protein